MKKTTKIILKFFNLALILMLISCEKDLYDDNIYQSKLKVSYVNSTALENNKKLMLKINKSNYFSKNIAGRIITDSVSGYSIDTERVKYIEGENFNSYTFEIIKPDRTFLDNLVLMSKNQEEYKSYALRYTLTEEEKAKLNTSEYIDFTNKCKASEIKEANTLEEILAKMAYVENCDMVYSWEETLTITPCPYDGCLESPWATYSYGHVLVGNLICSFGGSGDNSNSEGNGPHPSTHGGNQGTIVSTPTLLDNPVQPPINCQALKDMLKKPIMNQTSPKKIKDALLDLQTNVTTPKEMMYAYSPTTTQETDMVENYYESLPNASDINVDFGTMAISIWIHSHWDPVNQYSVFSLSDLYTLYNILSNGNMFSPSTFTAILITADGTRYALRITNQTTFLNWGNTMFTGWGNNYNDASVSIDETFYNSFVKTSDNNEDQLHGFLTFIRLQGIPMEVYELNSTFTNSTLVELDNNRKTKRTSCP